MIYLAANHTRVWDLRRKGYPLGWCLSPKSWLVPHRDGDVMDYAIDNGLYYDPSEYPKGMKVLPAFFKTLRRAQEYHEPIFVVCPDIPYDGERSLRFSLDYIRKLRRMGNWRIALAVQDGMEHSALDTADWDAVFVGGSTEWKWRTAARWGEHARDRHMWFHVGRVNTQNRIRQCIDIGADSADGTGLFKGTPQQTGMLLRTLIEAPLFSSNQAWQSTSTSSSTN